MKTIALGLPHLPGNPKRDAHLDETLNRLFPCIPPPVVISREFTEKEDNRVWARKMWKWGIETGADAFLSIQDDTEVMPEGFWLALEAMLVTLPKGSILGLAAAHPGGREMLHRGHKWYRTRAWVIGWGYLLWREDLEALVAYDEAGHGPRDNEDSFINRFVVETGRDVWHPVPSIVDHRSDLESSYGNDDHIHRRTVVRWEGYKPEELAAFGFWRPQSSEPPPLLPLPRTAPVPIDETKFRLSVATPVRGGLQPAHVMSLLALYNIRGVEVDKDASVNFQHEWEDLVRVRSRMVRRAHEGDCTHLLFGDADVAFEPQAVAGMLVSGKDFVQCPYPRRDGLKYTILPLEEHQARGHWTGADIEPGNVIRFRGTGLGLTLVSRAAMQAMLVHYGDEPLPIEAFAFIEARLEAGLSLSLRDALTEAYELGRRHGHRLTYLDVVSGRPELTVALFQLLLRDGALMGEDMSFVTRWRDIGGETYLYVGEGSPCSHWGEARFDGKIEHLGLSRGKAAE